MALRGVVTRAAGWLRKGGSPRSSSDWFVQEKGGNGEWMRPADNRQSESSWCGSDGGFPVLHSAQLTRYRANTHEMTLPRSRRKQLRNQLPDHQRADPNSGRLGADLHPFSRELPGNRKRQGAAKKRGDGGGLQLNQRRGLARQCPKLAKPDSHPKSNNLTILPTMSEAGCHILFDAGGVDVFFFFDGKGGVPLVGQERPFHMRLFSRGS